MSCRTNSVTKLTRCSTTFYVFGLDMIDHSLFVSSRVVTTLTLPRARVVLVHQLRYFTVQIIYRLTMISRFMYHKRVSCVAKLWTYGTRETFSIYVFGLNMGLDMWYLFRAVIALGALPLVLYIFKHHTFHHVVQLIIKWRTLIKRISLFQCRLLFRTGSILCHVSYTCETLKNYWLDRTDGKHRTETQLTECAWILHV